MKPTNWETTDPENKLMVARRLFDSMRGQYIMGQALFKASEMMRKEKYPETSNIQDMEILAEMIFPVGFYIARVENALKGGNHEINKNVRPRSRAKTRS